MESSNLQRRYIDFTSTLFREGFLDSQYTQLQQLQDESNPDFVTEVVTLFFQDSEKLQDELSRTLDQEVVDFKKVAAHVHQLKGSSASILTKPPLIYHGSVACRSLCKRDNNNNQHENVCMAFRICCEEMNREGCLRCLQQVRQEYFLVKSKLETLFLLEQQIVAAGGSIPIMW
ncbi:unnamed protein product [Musa acuminata subsp. burmannicoides]